MRQEIGALRDQAIALHRAGDLASAIQAYGQWLRLDGRNAFALMGRGVARLALSQLDEAVADFGSAIAIDPANPEAHNNLGIALSRSGQMAKAAAAYGQAIALDPRMAAAYGNRGDLHLQGGEIGLAFSDLDRAIALDPNLAAPRLGLARAKRAAGDFQGAVEAYLFVARLRPNDATIVFELGVAMGLAGFHEEALAALDAASGLGANLASVLAGKAELLSRLGRHADAVEHYDQLIQAAPDLAEAHYNRGMMLEKLERAEESLVAYDRALALRPDMAEALVNRGIVQHRLGYLAAAVASFDAAIRLNPDNAATHNNRGAALHDSARFDEALAAFDLAIAMQPDNVLAHNNRAFTLLMQGDFAAGWKALEWRKRAAEPIGVHPGAAPAWTGAEDLRGKRLHVFVEQGLGDILQFCRLLPDLTAKGARVILSCPQGLHGLLRGFDQVELVDDHVPVQADFSLALMSIAGALDLDPAAMAPTSPYLQADPARIEAWRRRLGDGGFKIGISWRTSKAGERLGKGFDLLQLARIAAIPGVRLISLQKGADQELRDATGRMPIETLGDFDSAGGGFADTAAVLNLVDLVITADTSIAHLAGGLGVPTWVALKHVADWRWMHGRRLTPWYPTMTLFSQTQPGEWDEVFSAMRSSLLEQLG